MGQSFEFLTICRSLAWRVKTVEIAREFVCVTLCGEATREAPAQAELHPPTCAGYLKSVRKIATEPSQRLAAMVQSGVAAGRRQKGRMEWMKARKRLEMITTAFSLVGLASGFILLGIQILAKGNSDGAPIVGGVVGICLGTVFLWLAFSYWRYETLKS